MVYLSEQKRVTSINPRRDTAKENHNGDFLIERWRETSAGAEYGLFARYADLIFQSLCWAANAVTLAINVGPNLFQGTVIGPLWKCVTTWVAPRVHFHL
jgi:hypothetical protein